MIPIPLHQYDISLRPDCARVIIRPFIPVEESRVTTIIGRALELNENEAWSTSAACGGSLNFVIMTSMTC